MPIKHSYCLNDLTPTRHEQVGWLTVDRVKLIVNSQILSNCSLLLLSQIIYYYVKVDKVDIVDRARGIVIHRIELIVDRV